MQLSTAIPTVMAAIVIVIKSNGIPINPIVPKTVKQAIMFGIIVAKAILIDLKSTASIIKIPNITNASDFICESNKLCNILLYKIKIPETDIKYPSDL